MKKVLEINVDDIGYSGVYSLITNVIKNKNDNIKIDIAAYEHFENSQNIEDLKSVGCNVNYIGYTGNKLVKQFVCFLKLRNLIKKEQYDYVHIHSDVANKLLVMGLASKFGGVKHIILHSHASNVDGNNRQLKRIIHKMCCYFLKYVGTRFVACSDLASLWMFPNIPKDQVLMIKNGVDLDKFRFSESARHKIREKLKLTDSYLIGHIGRFAYQKNHEYLIDIFYETKKVILNAKLVLIGNGVLETSIRQKVNELNLSDSVIFYGLTNSVNEIFQAMDMFLLPSHFEGLPIVGVEAQAAGLPVLFSDKVTKEAKLTKHCKFLPIDNDSISLWVSEIKNLKDIHRVDVYDELMKQGFSLHETIRTIIKLYND